MRVEGNKSLTWNMSKSDKDEISTDICDQIWRATHRFQMPECAFERNTKTWVILFSGLLLHFTKNRQWRKKTWWKKPADAHLAGRELILIEVQHSVAFKRNLGQYVWCREDGVWKNVNKLVQTFQRKADQDGVGMALTVSALMKQGGWAAVGSAALSH